MSPPNIPRKNDVPVHVDSSGIINLVQSGYASRIIQAFPNPFLVSNEVSEELRLGTDSGHRSYFALIELLGAGVIELSTRGDEGEKIYESLVNFDPVVEEMLDAGEAATIAGAIESKAVAIIDERKARAVCKRRFRGRLRVVSTRDLFCQKVVMRELGPRVQRNIIRALRSRSPS